jgi:hypothetical protein
MRKLSAYFCAGLAFASSFAPNLARAQSWGSPTYRVASTLVSVPAATTDVACLSGVVAHRIRVLRVTVSASANAASVFPASIILRSTLDTGGTSTLKTNVAQSTGIAASGAVFTVWTVNPATLGTAAADLYESLMSISSTVIGMDIDFTNNGTAQPPTLLAATDALCVNFNGISLNTGVVEVNMTFQDMVP